MKNKENVKYNPEGFYERVKAAWERAGYPNQESFADASGINKGVVTKWQNGKTLPQTNTLIKICNTCGCDLEYLFGRSSTFKTEYNDIATETGLSEKAVKKLKGNKRKADNKDEYIDNGFHASDIQYIEDFPFFISSKVIPDLLSHLITEKSETTPGKTTLEIIAERIARRSADIALLYTNPEREYIVKAYLLAESETRPSEPNYITRLESLYKKHIRALMLRDKDNVSARIADTYNGFIQDTRSAISKDEYIEHIYITNQEQLFYLAHNALNEDNSQMFDYVNQIELMNVLHNYTKKIDKLRSDLLKVNGKHRSK